MGFRLPLALLLLFVVAIPLRAGEEAVDLEEAVREFAATQDAADRLAAALKITRGAAGDAVRVGQFLADAWSWPAAAAAGEVVTWERTSSDGVAHTVFAYAPEAYTPEKAWPVMVWIHGGVSRDEDGGGAGGVRMFQDEANAEGFVIVSPSTQDGAHWWAPSGAALIRGALRDAQRRWRIDPDQVAVMGFSDGGSGAYHLLAHDPSPYAVFVPMMGNPLVTRLFGGPTWSSNVGARPVWAVNGGKDQLYPSAEMKPFMDALRDAGARMAWTDEPEAGHEPSFLERRWDEIVTFWRKHPRVALPPKVVWASSAPEHDGRFAWVEIRSLDPDAAGDPDLAAPAEMALPAPTPRPRLGIVLDLESAGPGLTIGEVQEGTPAAAAGLEAGDVLVRVAGEALDGDPREAAMRLRAFLQTLVDEDGLFVVKRGEEELEIRTRPKILEMDRREPVRPKALGYDVRPGVVEAEVRDGNVIALRTSGVGAIRLHLAEPLVDLDAEIVVLLNGKERFRGRVARDVAYLLAQAAAEGPSGIPYEAYLDL